MRVSNLLTYPIKSCAGTSHQQARVARFGLAGDRELMLIDTDSRFLSQRELPRMALIDAHRVDNTLTLTAPDSPTLEVPMRSGEADRRARIWRDDVDVIDQGDAAAAWFSRFLGQPVRLVGTASSFSRPLNPSYAPRPTDQTAFADGYPLLLIAQASLDALNQHLAQRGLPALPMNRFRPNIVIDGADAFAEDEFGRIRIGEVVFDCVKPCARCSIPGVDQATGISDGKEPLATLATFRTHALGVVFGQNLVHADHGMLRVGDRVERL